MRNNVRAVIHRQKPMNIYPIQPHPPKNPHTKTKDPRRNTAGTTESRTKSTILRVKSHITIHPHPKYTYPAKTPQKKRTPPKRGYVIKTFFCFNPRGIKTAARTRHRKATLNCGHLFLYPSSILYLSRHPQQITKI